MANGNMEMGSKVNIGYTPTKGTNVTTFEFEVYRNNNVVSGYIIFAPSADGSATGFVIANNLPKSKANFQMPFTCVAGTDAGKTGRVRISNDSTSGLIQTWYSNIGVKVGCTYLIPVNYIAM